jgi:hypothetical protein
MFLDRSKFNDYTVDFAETRILWNYDIPIIVPDEMTVEEEVYLLASQQTLHLGNVSVDNILKSQYNDYIPLIRKNRQLLLKRDRTTQKRELINETLKSAKHISEEIHNKLIALDRKNETLGASTSVVIFQRLFTGIKACRFLIKYGYLFESYAIQRQVLEQVAFAFHVFHTRAVGEVVDPPKCIIELKKFHHKAGLLYGLLSKRTHLSLDQIKLYYQPDRGKDTNTLTYTSLEYSLQSLRDFLILLDIYCATWEYCFNDKKNELQFITRKNTLKKNRPTEKLRKTYEQRLSKFSKAG